METKKKRRRGGRRHNAAAAPQVPGLDAAATMEERKHALLAAAQARGSADAEWNPATAASAAAAAAADRSDKDTLMSRRSSTRSHISKGSGEQARNLARLAQHLQKQGRVYNPELSQEAATAAASRATGLPGSVARSMYTHIIRQAQEIEDNDVMIGRYLKMQINECIAKRIEDRLVPESERMCVRDQFCWTCNKHATDAHVASDRHKQLIRTQACISFFCGMPSPSCRRQLFCGAFPSVPGGVITQRDLRNWWGDELESFPLVAKSIIAQGLCREVHLKDPSSVITLGTNECTPGTLYVIPYATGLGMYARHSKDIEAIRFTDVPPGAPPAPGADRNEDEVHMELLTVAAAQQKERSMGWWPVLRWHPLEHAAVHHRSKLENDVYVSCIYQWFDSLGSDGITAWCLLKEAMYEEEDK